jgi:hypothetical protein
MPVVSAVDTVAQRVTGCKGVFSDANLKPEITTKHITSPGSVVYKRTEMERVCSLSLPSAWDITEQIPREIIPTWNPDVKKLADAVALAYNALNGLSTGNARI